MCTLSSFLPNLWFKPAITKTQDFLSKHDFQVNFCYNFLWRRKKLRICHSSPPKCPIPISIFVLFVTRRSVVKLFKVLKPLGKWKIAIYYFRIFSCMWSNTLMSVCQTCTLMKIFAVFCICLRHNLTRPWCSYWYGKYFT